MKTSAICLVIFLGISSRADADGQLTAPERSTIALLNSIIDIISLKIDDSSCYEMRGQYKLRLFATGMVAQRRQNNMIEVNMPDHDISVVAYPKDTITDIGSQIATVYTPTSDYNLYDPIKKHQAVYSFNATSELLTMDSHSELFINDGYLKTKTYSSSAITSFSFSNPEDTASANIGWGMSQLSTPEYPKFKYWQRIKISKDDGEKARSLLLRDLLVYRQTCRIKVELIGHNSIELISQQGNLTIDMSSPDDPVVISLQ